METDEAHQLLEMPVNARGGQAISRSKSQATQRILIRHTDQPLLRLRPRPAARTYLSRPARQFGLQRLKILPAITPGVDSANTAASTKKGHPKMALLVKRPGKGPCL
jgi:hypothetical protein